VLAHIERILRGNPQRAVGLEQGSAPSCTSLNVLLHVNLDSPLTRTHPGIVFGRYSDDTVVAAQGEDESHSAIRAAQQLLSPLGLNLKGEQPRPVDIRRDAIEYLGFKLRWVNDGFRFSLSSNAWRNLSWNLAMPIARFSEPVNIATGWLLAHAPALWHNNQRLRTVNRLLDTLHQHQMHVDRLTLMSIYNSAVTSWKSFLAKDSEGNSLTRRTDVTEERICDRDAWMEGERIRDNQSYASTFQEASNRSRSGTA
jgi:hypothetical protein